MQVKLYGHPLSGNAHRVQVLLGVLGVAHDYVTVDLPKGAHTQPEFLALNPLGQVPVLRDGDLVLRDSTAIMIYLAETFDAAHTWLPADPAGKARVQQWLSTAVNEVMSGPFLVRAIKLFGAPADAETAKAKTTALFDTLFEPHLKKNRWLVGDSPTLADLACYGYVARVTEGDYALDAYPAISAWLKRVEGIENFTGMAHAADIFAAA